jgi:hypothetical protein
MLKRWRRKTGGMALCRRLGKVWIVHSLTVGWAWHAVGGVLTWGTDEELHCVVK